MHKEQDAKLTLVLTSMEDIKSTTKPKTAWDIANDTFEKNKETLNPQKNTFNALVDALDQRHPGTCLWIFKHQQYIDWYKSTTNGMLCINGQES